MDGLSNKITIEFRFNASKKVDQALVKSHKHRILVEVEGELFVFIDGELFFHDEYILLMELGISLFKWKESSRRGIVESFHYQTMDYDEGPILELIKIDRENWKIYSIWQKFESNELIPFKILQKGINTFLENLENELEKQDMIDIRSYL